MIFVQRTTKPGILARKEVAWIAAIKAAKSALDADNSPANRTQLDQAIGKYRHSEVKESLEQMFHSKCAYCESYISNVDYGDIEHFKPKSKFPELSVTWENLLLSCKICNGTAHKGEKWPAPADGGPLVNPCKENPEDFFEFIFDVHTQVTIVKPKNMRGETSETIYGLNRHYLVNDRNKYVRQLIAIAQYYSTDEEAKAIIDQAAQSQGEYAAFARMVKAKYTK